MDSLLYFHNKLLRALDTLRPYNQRLSMPRIPMTTHINNDVSVDDNALILGIGNLLWADEGFGVRCVEALAAAWELPATVTVMDGGTQGLYLLPYVSAARRLIVFDAVDYGIAM